MSTVHLSTRQPGALALFWSRARRNKGTAIGLVLVLVMVASAILAPWIAPHDPLEQDIIARLEPPSDTYLLGTDPMAATSCPASCGAAGCRCSSAPRRC